MIKGLCGIAALFAAMAIFSGYCYGYDYPKQSVYGDWSFIENSDGTLTIVWYNGNEEYIEIPQEIRGDTVTAIGQSAFSGCESAREIIVPESVTYIDRSAFLNCENLQRVNIPWGVYFIGGSAFSGCSSLKSIVIPGNVEYIGSNAFEGCVSLEQATLYDGVITIGEEAFSGCGHLTEITLPSSVQSVGEGAFENCAYLEEVYWSESADTIPENCFSGCKDLNWVELPEGLLYINDKAFDGCMRIGRIVIPASVIGIHTGAFPESNNLILHCHMGTYGESFAKEHEYRLWLIDDDLAISGEGNIAVTEDSGHEDIVVEEYEPEVLEDNSGILVIVLCSWVFVAAAVILCVVIAKKREK